MRLGFRYYLLDAEGTLYRVPIPVERSSFSILTFQKSGALMSPLLDPHVRARAELALTLEQPSRDTAVADASTRFLARGGQ